MEFQGIALGKFKTHYLLISYILEAVQMESRIFPYTRLDYPLMRELPLIFNFSLEFNVC